MTFVLQTVLIVAFVAIIFVAALLLFSASQDSATEYWKVGGEHDRKKFEKDMGIKPSRHNKF